MKYRIAENNELCYHLCKMMERSVHNELIISYHRETLSARVYMLDNLSYNRYSLFFNQQLTDIGPSHLLISKRVTEYDYMWVCEETSVIQDDELAQLAGNEIDHLFV